MFVVLAFVLIAALVAPFAGSLSKATMGEPLPTDPCLVTGTLDNGFTYIIRRQPNPEGRMGIWLHVASGSLNETEATRGLAHYLEHMAFNGSAGFPPGSVVPFFESLGLTFGRDQNAFTSFEQTTYQISVPSGSPDALEKALLFMADVAMRLFLLPEEIDKERQVILEEKRTRAGAEQRAQDYVLERLAPESTFGRRLPIGTEAAIRSVTPEDFRDYYRRWYVPSNMTLIAVGEGDPPALVAMIERHFGSGPKAPRPEPRPVGVAATTGTRAIVASDPELTRAEVSLVRVEPPRRPTTTVPEFRRDLVELVGAWILNRRLSADAAEGRAKFQRAHAAVRQWPGAMRTITVSASGRPDAWRAMLGDLGSALQRARIHGLGEREVADARRALIAEARDAVQRDDTRPIRGVLYEINGAVTRGAPVMSASQRLALLERLLPDVTAREVSETVAATFDPGHVIFIAELPANAAGPAEAELLALGRAAVDVAPEAYAEATRPSALLPVLPPGGAIVDTRTDAPSGVTSFWLDNGVRGHHRFMDQRRGEVIAIITLAGGPIQEQAANRGITEAAAQAWIRPATSRLSSTAIRDLLTGKRARVDVEVGEDAVALTLRSSPGDLETALQLAYLLLTDPLIEPHALEQWKESQADATVARRHEPMQALRQFAAEARFPAGEPRTQPLTPEQIRAIDRDAAQAWLRTLIASAPIEIALVGDIERSQALGLVSRYLGALPERRRISDKTLGELRTITRPAGPIRVAREIETRTPQAAVLVGFFGANARDIRDARLLAAAARVLSTRMYRALREEQQLVYSIGAVSRPALAYPGFGLFSAQAPTDPARVHDLAGRVEEMYARFAAEGPTEAEMTIARQQLSRAVSDELQRPEFWANRLSAIDYRGLSVAHLLDGPQAYAQLGTQEVSDAFRRHYTPDARFTVVVTPRGRE
jgi:zinc protease